MVCVVPMYRTVPVPAVKAPVFEKASWRSRVCAAVKVIVPVPLRVPVTSTVPVPPSDIALLLATVELKVMLLAPDVVSVEEIVQAPEREIAAAALSVIAPDRATVPEMVPVPVLFVIVPLPPVREPPDNERVFPARSRVDGERTRNTAYAVQPYGAWRMSLC